MEFLEKLYSQEYFAPVLFIIIAILAVLFVIVLALALKDAKKNKKKVENNENNSVDNNAFAPVSEAPQDVTIDIVPDEVPVQQPVQEEAAQNVVQENVVSSVEPTPSGFENVQIDAPVASEEIASPAVENQETTISPSVETPVAPASEVVNPVETNMPINPTEIKVEESPVASAEDVAKAENDLDAIAATLLSEYQKDDNKETETVEKNIQQPEQISPVFVTPNVLPGNEEQSVELPNLTDIPAPQPVRVTETSTVIDSSKQNLNNIPTEEYNINK